MSQRQSPTHTKQGVSVSYEGEARKIADSLRASASGVPFGFLVAAARCFLADGTPLRDSAVIAKAKAYQREQFDAVERWRKRFGLPTIAKAESEGRYAA
jgi:hypothetical protein